MLTRCDICTILITEQVPFTNPSNTHFGNEIVERGVFNQSYKIF